MNTLAGPLLLAAQSPAAAASPSGHDVWLIAVLVIGIGFVAVAVAVLKLHPILALLIGGVIVGLAGGLGVSDTVSGLTTGVGNSLGGTGLLIVLGALFGTILSESGAAARIVGALTSRVGPRGLPWVVLVASVVVGLPMFFEVGFVTLIPIAIVLSKSANVRLSRIAFPLLAGLDAAQCLLPPHPGPVAAATALNANVGLMLLVGFVVALPAIILTGPVLGRIMANRVDMSPPKAIEELYTRSRESAPRPPGALRSFVVVLVPVALIMGKAAVDLFWSDGSGALYSVLELVGTPPIALLISVITAMVLLGTVSGTPRQTLNSWASAALGPVAGVTFIVGAAGGFSNLIVSSGSADALLDLAAGAGVPLLLLAFGMAAILVTALGSSTVAGLTAASLVAPSAGGLDPIHLVLLALAAGAGSSFFVHVNSGGFWLSKEYFGLTVAQNFRVWTLTHTLLSVISFAVVALLWVVL